MRSWWGFFDAYLNSIQAVLFRKFLNFQLLKHVHETLKSRYMWMAHDQTEYAFKITNLVAMGSPAQVVLRSTMIWSWSLAVTKMRVLPDGPPRGQGSSTIKGLLVDMQSDIEKDCTTHSYHHPGEVVQLKKVREMKLNRMGQCWRKWEGEE